MHWACEAGTCTAQAEVVPAKADEGGDSGASAKATKSSSGKQKKKKSH